LQQIRDEAHRVAITYHRKRRSKRLIQTELDQVPGIGPKKQAALLKAFGSVKQIKKGKQEDFEKLSILTEKDITNLLKFGQSSK